MRILTISAFVLMVVLTGCNEPTPEDRLESAGTELEQAEDSLESLNRRIEEHQDELARLRKERRQSENRLMTLEERVEMRATDVAVFRAVQSALLEAPDLSQAAIAVDTKNGLVTLSGVVTSEALHQQAVEIARSTAGVDRVRSRIDVEPPAQDGRSGAGETGNN